MNRKEFLKNCACGLCTCAAVGLITPESASGTEANVSDDRLSFVKTRYAKLLEVLSGRMDEKTLNAVLFDLGAYCCSSSSDEFLKKYCGDLEGFRQAAKQVGAKDDFTYDREKGVITMVSEDRTDCFCQLISRLAGTPKVACNCSLGFQQHMWETLLQKKVKVELKESVLLGGKRCVFEIRVLDQSA